MPATKAYPRGALVPRERNTPEILADRDSAKISGPRPAGVARTAAATASTSTAALIAAASQARAGRWGEDSPAATGGSPSAAEGGWRPAAGRFGRSPSRPGSRPDQEPPPTAPGEQTAGSSPRWGPAGRSQAGHPAVREHRRVDRTARPAKERHPHHQHPQRGISRPAQNVALHPTGARETRRSSGGENQHQAGVPIVAVEQAFQS